MLDHYINRFLRVCRDNLEVFIMITKTNAIMAVIIIVLLLVLGAALKAWYAEKNKIVISTGSYVELPAVPKAAKIKHTPLPGPKTVSTIDKKEIEKKLELPSWFAQNADEQAIATAEVPPYEGCTDIVCTLNTKSGEGKIIAKQRPLSLFAFENKKELGGRLGYTSKEFKQIITGFGRWQFLRVGNFHAGLYGEGNTEGEAIGQLELIYRF